jgi:hypothetical protein
MRDRAATIETIAQTHNGRQWFTISFVLLALVHGALTLQLFGPQNPWRRMLNGDPVTSGRHCLFLEQTQGPHPSVRRNARFDPCSYAGRPGDPACDPTVPVIGWLRRIGVGPLPPAACKIALAASYWLVPFGLALSIVLMGHGRGTGVAVALVATVACWVRPAGDWVENGDPCLAVVFTWASICSALLRSWHHEPYARRWCGSFGGLSLGWLTQPALWSALLLLPLVGWALVRREHNRGWNVACALGSVVVAVSGLIVCGPRLPTWWENVWGHAPVGTGMVREIVAAAIWLAVIPSGQALATVGRWFAGRQSAGFMLGSVAVLTVAVLLVYRPADDRWRDWWGPRPLLTGLPIEGLELEQTIRAAAPAGARVLLEDLAGRPDLAWTALLARRCGPDFVGGVDPDGTLEHSACALRDGSLAGRPIEAWTDADLDAYARRYNIGCIVCKTASARARVHRWPTATAVNGNELTAWAVFVLRRPYSFVLKGRTGAVVADDRGLTLTDVAPEDGEIVLSLHYQPGWQVRPACVHIERELDPYDPIPLVRLKAPGRVGRVTVTWGGR